MWSQTVLASESRSAYLVVAAVSLAAPSFHPSQLNNGSESVGAILVSNTAKRCLQRIAGPDTARIDLEPKYAGINVISSSLVKLPVPNHGLHDFGTHSVLDVDNVTCSFLVRNSTKSPIVLTELRPSCGCTIAVVKHITNEGLQKNSVSGQTDVVLGAGNTASIDVSVDLKPLGAGLVQKYVSIFAKGLTGPVALLEMTGTISPSVEFSPTYLRFDSNWAEPSKTKHISLLIDRRLAANQNPTLVCDDPSFTVTAVPAVKDGHDVKSNSASPPKLQREYLVTLNNNSPIGTTMARLRLLPLPNASPVAMAALTSSSGVVVSRVKGDLLISPQIMAFGAIGSASKLHGRITLRGKNASCFSNLTIATTSKYIAAKLSDQDPRPNVQDAETPDSVVQELEITFVPPAGLTGPFTAQIKLVLSNGQFALIPVTATIEADRPHL